ncbi:MAG: flagellar hook capping family protein [Alphaproteobacteria bacterium]|nr:flagellar hook capping family protein [Alphaproteobacteria bacterium]
MVSNVTINTALDQQSKTAAAQDKLATDFSQFLSLLTTQLQHQDPLSPMDTTEFTNQLVAFTGVEQQINTNQKLDSLVSLQLGNAMGSALGYVGLDVSYISSEFYNDGNGAPSTINYAMDSEAITAKLRIYDESGDLVYETDAEKAPGSHEFVWDGLDKYGNPVEPGTYDVSIDALDINDDAVGSTIVVEGRVRGVETQGGSIFLLVGDRAVSTGNILNVSLPPEPSTPPEEIPEGGSDA